MHELGIAEEIIRVADQGRQGGRVTKVTLEIGKLSAVLPDALRFCWSLAAEGTALEGSELEIIEVPGAGRCEACGAEVEMHAPFTRCACGGSNLEWLRGDGLRLKSLEVV